VGAGGLPSVWRKASKARACSSDEAAGTGVGAGAGAGGVVAGAAAFLSFLLGFFFDFAGCSAGGVLSA
jgi:hypothetical protein